MSSFFFFFFFYLLTFFFPPPQMGGHAEMVQIVPVELAPERRNTPQEEDGQEVRHRPV
jgi:hypothetical protein